MSIKTKRLGWIKDAPDSRDIPYRVPRAVRRAPLPASFSVRDKCPAVYDQGNLGSCTANAIAGAVQFDQIRQDIPGHDIMPSRLFIYYNERVIEGTVKSDSGAQLRDGIKSVAGQGVCSASYWPYIIAKFAQKPNATAYAKAKLHPAVQYSKVAQDANQIKGCLASGFPLVFGFEVYESFESDAVAKTGVVPMPSPREKVLGGHAVMAVGYDDKAGVWIVRNSWGSGWGDGGYFTMPYAYLLNPNLASDFWTIRLVK